MWHRIILASLICLGLSLIPFVLTAKSYSRNIIGNGSEFSPGPKLLYPTTDDIDLSGKDYLEFRWERTDLTMTDYYDFRLYKGYNNIAQNLILKQRFPSDKYLIRIPASQFDKGQVYTWVLVQVFLGGNKSGKSYSSFKIIKK